MAAMRVALAGLSKQITAEYAADVGALLPGQALPYAPPGTGLVVPNEVENYDAGDKGIAYGNSMIVVGPRIKEGIPPTATIPANDSQIDEAIAALSEKRVTSLLRNVVVAVHATFPDQTVTAGDPGTPVATGSDDNE